MSSGLRLRRPVFLPPDSAVLSVFVASLFALSFFPSSVFLPVFRFSLAGPHFPLPAFPFARVSLCPCLPLSVSPSVRVSLSPHLASFVGPSSFVCIPSGFSSVISCFSVHRPSLAACCPSPVAPSIVHRPPFVVRRPLRRPSSSACRLLSVARCPSLAARCLLSVVHCPSFAARCLSPVASPVPRRRAAPLSAALRSGSRLLYPRNPGLRVCGSCLPCRSAAGSVGRSFRKNASALRTLVAAPFLTK